MRLKAELVIEVEATDFVAAANHQQEIEKLAETYREIYPGLTCTFRQVKERSVAANQMTLRKMPRYTGNLALYDK